MNIQKQIKKDALLSLQNKWAFPIFMSLIFLSFYLLFAYVANLFHLVFSEYKILNYSIVFFNGFKIDMNAFVFNISSFMLNIGFLFTTIPFSVGAVRWYIKNINDSTATSADFYHYFSKKNYFKTIGLKLAISFKMILWGIVFLSPGIFAIVMAFIGNLHYTNNNISPASFNFTGDFSVILLVLGIFLIFAGLIILLLLSYRYILAPYLLVVSPKTKVIQLIDQSIFYSKGNFKKLFFFQLSFLPLFLSCILVIPALFVIPYYNSSLAIYAQYLFHLKDNSISKYTRIVN